MGTKIKELDKSGQRIERSALDPSLLVLQEDELIFFKEQTGITDDQKLREHILQIQEEAYKHFPYPCIHRFRFTNLKISRLPEYDYVLQLGRKEGTIFLEVGCCFGNDVRTVVAHGFPMQNVVAFDLRSGFWDLGHKLFKSTPDTFPVVFIEGDILDPTTLSLSSPSFTTSTTGPPSLLHLGNSLNGLRHHVSVIHASSFFHLFSEDQQLQVARNLAALLSPLPGSIILGSHIGLPSPGIKPDNLSGERNMFCHSPESWCSMWDGVVFKKASVEVRAALVEGPKIAVDEGKGHDNTERRIITHWLKWSVKRL